MLARQSLIAAGVSLLLIVGAMRFVMQDAPQPSKTTGAAKPLALKRFKCIVIEFHNFHDIINPIALKIYSSIFNKILKTHFIVHMHPNNISRVLTINKNNISNLYEITFINKKVAKYIKKINYEMPHKLDEKCCSDLDEIKCPKIFYK